MRFPTTPMPSSSPATQSTASVHYIGFMLTSEQVAAVASGSTTMLAAVHENYAHGTELHEATVEELLVDLRGG